MRGQKAFGERLRLFALRLARIGNLPGQSVDFQLKFLFLQLIDFNVFGLVGGQGNCWQFGGFWFGPAVRRLFNFATTAEAPSWCGSCPGSKRHSPEAARQTEPSMPTSTVLEFISHSVFHRRLSASVVKGWKIQNEEK